MPPTTEASARGFDIDRATFTIRLERLVDAPAAAVFAAWTRPEEIAQWWDPDGAPLVRCEIDLKPGGSFTFVPKNHPEMPFAGTYREINPPDRLVFEAMGATGRVSLAEAGGRTRMTVTITCRSAEHLDQYIEMGVAKGTAQTLDNLMAFVRRRAA
jgi:uncharacterized protein YndB with AHSA1/START domain